MAQRPLVPFVVFSGETGFVLGGAGFGWASFGIWLYYIWQFFLQIRHYSPLEAAAYFFPVLPMGLLATGLTGYLMHSIRPALILTISMAAFTLGLVLLATVSATQTYWAFTFLSLAIIPFGMDMIIISNELPKDQQGMAGSLASTVITYSISLGLGLAAAVEVYANKGGRTPEDILNGFKGPWYLGIGLGALGLLVALAFLLSEVMHARRRWATIEGHQPSSEQKLQLSPTKTLTPSLRTWPSQTTLAQRDSRSVLILPHYDRQPPLPSPKSSVLQMFEQEKRDDLTDDARNLSLRSVKDRRDTAKGDREAVVFFAWRTFTTPLYEYFSPIYVQRGR